MAGVHPPYVPVALAEQEAYVCLLAHVPLLDKFTRNILLAQIKIVLLQLGDPRHS